MQRISSPQKRQNLFLAEKWRPGRDTGDNAD